MRSQSKFLIALFLCLGVCASARAQIAASDNFVRANGPLGINWTNIADNGNSPAISSNTVISPGGGRAKALYYGGYNWPADQFAQLQIISQASGSTGPAVREQTPGSGYYCTVGALGTGNATVFILLDNAGSQSVLVSTSTATVLANDYIKLSITGSTIACTDVTRSSTLLTTTDSTIVAGYPGFYNGGGVLTNFTAGAATNPQLTTLASDNFNRVNAPTLGASWTAGFTTYNLQIISHQVESAGQGQAPGNGHGKAWYSAVTFPSDQWSQAQVISSTGDVNGAIVRYQGTADTHYVGFVGQTGSPGTCQVSVDRDIAGAPIVIATDTSNCSVTAGDTLRLQVQGTLLTYIDTTTGGLLLTVTDTAITGGAPGWSLSPIGGTPTMATWSGGTLGLVSANNALWWLIP